MENLSINVIPNWEEETMMILEVNSGLAASDGMFPFYWKNNEISDAIGIMMIEYNDISKIDEKDKSRFIIRFNNREDFQHTSNINEKGKYREILRFNNREEFQCILDKGIESTDGNKFYKVSLLNFISYEEIIERMIEYKKEVKAFADHWQLETGYFNRNLWK